MELKISYYKINNRDCITIQTQYYHTMGKLYYGMKTINKNTEQEINNINKIFSCSIM